MPASHPSTTNGRIPTTIGAISLAIAGVMLTAAGCGPLTRILSEPLDEAGRARVDSAWDHLLSPVDRAGHGELLDVIVMHGAYQLGVDRIEFRSEKRFSGGTVFMEARQDRHAPDADRFIVTVVDEHGEPVRVEEFTRVEVERAYDELFTPVEVVRNGGAGVGRHANGEARRARAAELFPLGLASRAEGGAP